MPTTTATTTPPIAAHPDGLTIRQRVSRPLPSLGDAVRERIGELHHQGAQTFALDDFKEAARQSGRPLSWIGDHLLVLEGIGILRAVRSSSGRVWAVGQDAGYLR